jgi:surface polysaccharide O-acyltransferase-like enzyme
VSGSERLHALDAVRSFALLLGVALHGANAYVAGFPWILSDDPATSMAVTVYVIHIFRMTLFFLIAGFFAHLAFHRKGRPAFVRDRLMRVGVPLAAGWFVLMPAMAIASVLAAIVTTGGIVPSAPPAEVGTGASPPGGIVAAVVNGFPWGHLWFLWMLLGFYALALAGRALVTWLDRGQVVERAADRGVAWLVRGHLAPLVLGAPILALYLSVGEPARWFTIPSPISGLIPDAVSSTGFSVAFLFGWLLHRQRELVRVWEQRFVLNSALALASTGACLAIGGWNLMAEPGVDYAITAIHATAYIVAIWTWSFAVVGVALRFLSSYNAVIRYVSDASYWIYLVHVPVVMVLHVGLTFVDWPPLLKFLVVCGVTTAVCLATYQVMVRHTFIGVVLNGRRGGTGASQAEVAPVPAGV